ncbi:PREDICTED: putative uncharacterized protein encoded by LINC00269, partial [Propithecus coquereli]|uniref:putative uncharacterized protein encoded by LINC00269 n=1 Tax=Propithecus coquereli TaxID=379532 RepID=UPI00063F18E8
SNLKLLGSSDPSASASRVAGGLELLSSDNPPTSASQSARITGVSHGARPLRTLKAILSKMNRNDIALSLMNALDKERDDIGKK